MSVRGWRKFDLIDVCHRKEREDLVGGGSHRRAGGGVGQRRVATCLTNFGRIWTGSHFQWSRITGSNVDYIYINLYTTTGRGTSSDRVPRINKAELYELDRIYFISNSCLYFLFLRLENDITQIIIFTEHAKLQPLLTVLPHMTQ